MEEPQLSFRVSDEYEGPLDLILALITKHQVNIWDIEITSLLEQYMAYIRARQEQDLEVASEFLKIFDITHIVVKNYAATQTTDQNYQAVSISAVSDEAVEIFSNEYK